MTDDNKKTEKSTEKKPVAKKASGGDLAAPRERTAKKKGGPRGRKRGSQADVREQPEFDQKIVDIRRVTRVVKGGRRFSFSVAVVVGDRNGRVGVGVDKGGDTAAAIEKATRDAKKNVITVKRDKETHSIAHEAGAKYASTEIVVRPSPGRGIVAGSSARTVLELAGLHDVGAKILSRSKSKINIARATISALRKL